jgi:DME family drug/metabolite transporter
MITDSDTRPGPGRLGLIQVSLAGVLWGTGGLGVQIIREHEPMSVLTISAWRMVLATLVLAVLVGAQRQLADVRRLWATHRRAALLAGVATGTYQALYFGAVVTVGVTVATVVSLGVAPVLVATYEAILQRRRPDRSTVAVLVVALAGLLLVSSTAGLGATGPRPGLGVALATASGAVYGFTTVVAGRIASATTPLALTTVATAAGAVALIPFGLVAARGEAPLISADPVVIGTLVYLGAVTMALAYGLLYAGLRTTTSSTAVVASLLEPVTAAVVAALLLDERLGAAGILGTLLILAAVAGLGRREPAPATPPP